MGAEANKLVLIGTGTAVVGTGAVEPGRPSQPWSVSCVQPPHLRGGLRSPLSLGVLARIERGVRPWSAAQLVVSTQQEERLRGSACPPPPSYPPSQPTPPAQPCSSSPDAAHPPENAWRPGFPGKLGTGIRERLNPVHTPFSESWLRAWCLPLSAYSPVGGSEGPVMQTFGGAREGEWGTLMGTVGGTSLKGSCLSCTRS